MVIILVIDTLRGVLAATAPRSDSNIDPGRYLRTPSRSKMLSVYRLLSPSGGPIDIPEW